MTSKYKIKIKVAHATPGRIRLKVRHAKGNPEVLNAVADGFRSIPGIERVDINPVTGSVVLNYDPDRQSEFASQFERRREVVEGPSYRPPQTDIDKFADTIQREAEFLAEHSAGARAFVDLCKRLDREIKVATGNNVDLKLMLGAGVLAAVVLEVGVTAATPVWVTLLLFGANHYVELHHQALHQRTLRPGKAAEGPR
jgi:hypothetical protein